MPFKNFIEGGSQSSNGGERRRRGMHLKTKG